MFIISEFDQFEQQKTLDLIGMRKERAPKSRSFF